MGDHRRPLNRMGYDGGMRRATAAAGIPFLALVSLAAACGSDDSSTAAPPDGSTSDMTVGPGMDGGPQPGNDAPVGSDTSMPPSDSGGVPEAEAGPPPSKASVYQHHKNGTRDGLYVDPIFTKATAATTHVLTTFAGTTSVSVRAQPLYVEDGPGGNEAFIVATETNHVTAIDGTGMTIWDKGPQTYGDAVTNNLPCGNINPLGITGTPFIDIASRTIYFDAMTTPDNNSTLLHKVFAVSLDDGSIKPNWPVSVTATVPGFDSPHQNQRGALQLLNGILYVPYGGHDGDCDPYFGWVVGVPVNDPQHPKSWHTQAQRGGIWGSGSLPTDGVSIFPVTGNTEGTSTWGGGEAVIRLAAGPTFSGAKADYYAPADWQNLDNADLDLGGANDFLVDMPGAPKPHLVVAPGKDQNVYLLDRDNLGGIGAELSKTHVANNEMNAAGAAYHTSQGTYLALRVANGGNGVNCPVGGGGNLVVVKVSAGNPPVPKVVWCSDESNLGSPIVTTTDGSSEAIVWDANDHLWAYDGDTGAKIFDGSTTLMNNAMHIFNTPIAAKGRIAIAVDGQLYLFTP